MSEQSSALFGGPLTYEQFRKLYPAVRQFQHYGSEERSNRASNFRMGHQQRRAIGEYFYCHDLCPNVAFRTAKAATESAFGIYQQQFHTETATQEVAK